MPLFNRSPISPTGGTAASSDTSQLWDVPKPKRDPKLLLAALVPAGELAAIKAAGQIAFHATGDTGVATTAQHDIADAMAKEIDVAHPANGPTFFLNLGDVIYGNGKKDLYADRFYKPNQNYLRPGGDFEGIILAIPGNHDGEVRTQADQPSLAAFWENFCADPDHPPPTAADFHAQMPDQPGVYWHLDAPFLDLIGLYSNAGENVGTLGRNAHDDHQAKWLKTALAGIKAARPGASRKALLLAVHHPPYASGLLAGGFGHAGSPLLLSQIDQACADAGIWPDAVISGHAHNYQRYLRECKDAAGHAFDISYVIAGTGGINTQAIPHNFGHQLTETPVPPGLASSGVTYSTGLQAHGYLRISASATALKLTFVKVAAGHTTVHETVVIDLATQQTISP